MCTCRSATSRYTNDKAEADSTLKQLTKTVNRQEAKLSLG